ncbi:hypothetical protein ABT063_35420 [Streptomyces sp. NPDC002838]|uniref:hypothetical protein n=1 Tax=Streptomyces sp. NPDC002838 TaxID=3154436 RepID=UPI0033309184
MQQEVGEQLRRVATAPDQPDTGVRMEYREFLDRVAQRAGADRILFAGSTGSVT